MDKTTPASLAKSLRGRTHDRKVRYAVLRALRMYHDGCHKIYLAMDAATVAEFDTRGYEHEALPDVGLVAEWYTSSCGLEFVDAVFNGGADNADFVTVVSQDVRWNP